MTCLETCVWLPSWMQLTNTATKGPQLGTKTTTDHGGDIDIIDRLGKWLHNFAKGRILATTANGALSEVTPFLSGV